MGSEGRRSGWVQTPWWHPRYWLGYTWREWQWDAWSWGAEYDGEWVYQTTQQRARHALEEAYGHQQSSNDGHPSNQGACSYIV